MIFNTKHIEETDNWALIIECSGTNYFIAEESFGGHSNEGAILDRDLDRRITIIRIYFPEDTTAKHSNSDRVKVSFNGIKRKNDPFIILPTDGTKAKFSERCKSQIKDVDVKVVKLVEEFVNFACGELHDYCDQSRNHPENISMEKLDNKYEEFLKIKKKKRRENKKNNLNKLRGK